MVCRGGRVVKAFDSKSNGLYPHRFESCPRRKFFVFIWITNLNRAVNTSNKWYDVRKISCVIFLSKATSKLVKNRKLLHDFCYFVSCHGMRGSASPVLTATGFVNGRWQFSTPHRIDTPWPITKKFVASDYVGDSYGCAKFGANPFTGGFWANGWNITKIFIYL